MSRFLTELKRRNIFRVAGVYAVVGWILMQVVSVMTPALNLPDWVDSFFAVVLIIGFPVAMLLAWAFEMAPEGMKRTEHIADGASITDKTGQKLDFAFIGGLVFVAALVIWQTTQAPQSKPSQTITAETKISAPERVSSVPKITQDIDRSKSIAVLPFADFSPDNDQEWFSDGLTEEILNSLARTPDLLVTSRTSSFKFKNTNEEIPIIAEKLGVAHVLEGSVRRGGNRLRITAQLIRANDGFHLWSQTYDSTSDDVIKIQEDIAIKIATALKTAMDPAALAQMADVGTNSIPAYEAYLEGKALEINSLEESNFKDANIAFERARQLDPNFADAHFRAAAFWDIGLTHTGATFVDIQGIDEGFKKYLVRMNAAIATTKNENRKLFYQAVKSFAQFNTGESTKAVEKYLEQYPLDVDAWNRLSYIYSWSGRYADASSAAQSGEKVGGREHLATGFFISSYVWAKDYENAARLSRASLASGSNIPSLLYQAHRALLWAGEYDEARALLPRIIASDFPQDAKLTAQIRQACADGDRPSAQALFKNTPLDVSKNNNSYWIIYHLLGQEDVATEMLRSLDRARPPVLLTNWLFYPYFDYTQHPYFVNILKREGIDLPPVSKIPFACPVEAPNE